MHHHEDLHDADLARVADRLRSDRPQLTALELDEVRRTVHARAALPARRRTRSEFMKSRLAILGMLVLGMLFSTTGAGLAISGIGDSHSAAVSQYGDEDNHGTGHRGGIPGGETTNPGGNQGTTPGTSPSQLQPTQQIEAGVGSQSSGGNLPFTGFAAIPVLLGGIVLLTLGVVMRRRSREHGA